MKFSMSERIEGAITESLSRLREDYFGSSTLAMFPAQHDPFESELGALLKATNNAKRSQRVYWRRTI